MDPGAYTEPNRVLATESLQSVHQKSQPYQLSTIHQTSIKYQTAIRTLISDNRTESDNRQQTRRRGVHPDQPTETGRICLSVGVVHCLALLFAVLHCPFASGPGV